MELQPSAPPTQPGVKVVPLPSDDAVILGRNVTTGITDSGLSRHVLSVRSTQQTLSPSTPQAVRVEPAAIKITGKLAAGVRTSGGEWRPLSFGESAHLMVGDEIALRLNPARHIFTIGTTRSAAAPGTSQSTASPHPRATTVPATAAHPKPTLAPPNSKRRKVVDGAVPAPSPTIRLGPYTLPALGIGTLPLGVTYSGGGRPSVPDAIDLIHTALRKGCRFFDVSDMYCAGPGDTHYAERLLMRAIREYDGGSLVDEVVVGTKGGMARSGQSSHSWVPKTFRTPGDLKRTIRESHEAMELGDRPIKLWSFHHTDGYPTDDGCQLFKQHLKAVRELMDEGIVELCGLANGSTAHIDAAISVLGKRFVAVQNEYSLYARAADRTPHRKSATVAKSNKNNTLEWCRTNGLAFCPTKALGGHPAREGKVNLAENFPIVQQLAAKKSVTPQVLLLAWMRHQHPQILHIVGCRTKDHLSDYLVEVPEVRFTQAELDQIAQLPQFKAK
eukprot:m.164593 g.164593  ORF g.164593 m.164593 type:complete len:501 (+) comp14658_c0_seq1:300-1802(+)